MKRARGNGRPLTSEAMQWAEARRQDPAHQEAIEGLLAAMRLEQELIALRERCGLTQVELATRAGVKQPLISKLESGKARNLELRTLVRIAAALGARPKISFEMAPAARTRKHAKTA